MNAVPWSRTRVIGRRDRVRRSAQEEGGRRRGKCRRVAVEKGVLEGKHDVALELVGREKGQQKKSDTGGTGRKHRGGV